MAISYFYVRDTGSRTTGGGDSSKRTGTWSATASDHYATVLAAYGDGAFAAGDFIVVSDAHNETITGATWGIITATPANTSIIICVDDSNQENYKPDTSGNIITCTSALTFRNIVIYGMSFTSNANNLFKQTTNYNNTFYDCRLEMTSSGTRDLYDLGGPSSLKLINCVMDTTNAAATTNFVGGSLTTVFELFGCKFTTSGGGSWVDMISFPSGTITFKATGCDLSEFSQVFDGFGGNASDDHAHVRLIDCQISSSLTRFDETVILSSLDYLESGCTDSTNDNPNQLYIEKYGATIESLIGTSSTANLRTDGQAMEMEDSSSYMSVKAVTAASAGALYVPVDFILPVTWSALSDGSTDTIRIYLASATSLTHADVKARIAYRDGTNSYQINLADGNPTLGDNDPWITTALTTDSGSTWSTGTVANKYYIDIPTSGDVGIDCVPEVQIDIRKENVTIYFDTEYDLVA